MDSCIQQHTQIAMGSIETALYCSGWGHSKSLHTKLLLNRSRCLGHCQLGLENLQERGVHGPSGQSVPMLDGCHNDGFSLKPEPPCMTTAFHPPAIHLRKEFCSIFLINSGTKRKLLGFPPGLLTGCPDSLTRDFSMCNAAGLPVPSLVSCLINWPS